MDNVSYRGQVGKFLLFIVIRLSHYDSSFPDLRIHQYGHLNTPAQASRDTCVRIREWGSIRLISLVRSEHVFSTRHPEAFDLRNELEITAEKRCKIEK